MAYNLYQVQAARAWTQRIEKENKIAEKFWMTQAMGETAGFNRTDDQQHHHHHHHHQLAENYADSPCSVAARSVAAGSLAASRHGGGPKSVASYVSSAAPSGFTTKTSYMHARLERLETELAAERASRRRVEQDLEQLKTVATPVGSPRH